MILILYLKITRDEAIASIVKPVDGLFLLEDFSACTDVIISRSRDRAFFIADVVGDEQWRLFVVNVSDSTIEDSLVVADPSLALSAARNLFYFKVVIKGVTKTVRCDYSQDLPEYQIVSFPDDEAVLRVGLSSPLLSPKYYTFKDLSNGSILAVKYDMATNSPIELIRSRIFPCTFISTEFLLRFENFVLEKCFFSNFNFLTCFRESKFSSIFTSIDFGNDVQIFNTYGVYDSVLPEVSGFPFFGDDISVYEHSLSRNFNSLDDYSDYIAEYLSSTKRMRDFFSVASTVSAGSIPLLLSYIRFPESVDGLIFSRSLSFPFDGKFRSSVDEEYIAGRLSKAAKQELLDFDPMANFEVPVLILSAFYDSRIPFPDRFGFVGDFSSCYIFEHAGGHLNFPADVNILLELLRIFFILEVCGFV